MIPWICGGVMTGAALLAALLPDVRRAALSLWIAGLAAGGIYLSIGAEALAIIQWVLSTLVAVAIVFFSVMFGEYRGEDRVWKLSRKDWLFMGLSALGGCVFLAALYLAVDGPDFAQLSLPETGGDLASLGRVLSEKHMISLEVVALSLFMVLIGGSLMARPESKSGHEPEEHSA